MSIEDLNVQRLDFEKFASGSDPAAPPTGFVRSYVVGNQIFLKDTDNNVISVDLSVVKAFSTTTGAVALDLLTGNTFTVTPTGDITLTATNLTNLAGKTITLVITSTGTTSRTITFSTGFATTPTFKTGTVASVIRILRFYCNGTDLREIGNRQPLGTTALTPGATVAVEPSQGDLFTLTPGEDETINAATVHNGYEFMIKVSTSGTTSRTLTFNTGFKSTGTLATGTSDAKIFLIRFKSDGTQYCEVSRTAAQ